MTQDQQQAREDLLRLESIKRELQETQDIEVLREAALKPVDAMMKVKRKDWAGLTTGARA